MVEKLKTNFTKGCFKFEQLCRTEHAAIYQKYLKVDKNWVKSSIEIFKIKIFPAYKLNEYEYPESEHMPQNEEFGKSAWSVGHWQKEKAFKLFDSIKNDIIPKKETPFIIFKDYKIRYYADKKICIVIKNNKPHNKPKEILMQYHIEKFNKTFDEVKDLSSIKLAKEIFGETNE